MILFDPFSTMHGGILLILLILMVLSSFLILLILLILSLFLIIFLILFYPFDPFWSFSILHGPLDPFLILSRPAGPGNIGNPGAPAWLLLRMAACPLTSPGGAGARWDLAGSGNDSCSALWLMRITHPPFIYIQPNTLTYPHTPSHAHTTF